MVRWSCRGLVPLLANLRPPAIIGGDILKCEHLKDLVGGIRTGIAAIQRRQHAKLGLEL